MSEIGEGKRSTKTERRERALVKRHEASRVGKSHVISGTGGYEYRVVGYCEFTGRSWVAPIFWSGDKVPFYPTCICHKRGG